MLIWEDLFNFVYDKCGFRFEGGEKGKGVEWTCTCHQDMRFTEQFLKDNPDVDSVYIMKKLRDTGGLCDCEVLLNSAQDFSDKGYLKEELPLKITA